MKKNFIALMTGSLLTGMAFATPTIYPKDLTFLSVINNPTTSNLVADDSDINVIWVMPPNVASAKVEGLHSITANVGFCKEMANLQSYSADLTLKMKELKIKEIEADEHMQKMLEKLSQARQKLAQYVVANNLADIQELDNRLFLVEEQIDVLNESLMNCEQYCFEIRDQLADLKKERNRLAKDRRELTRHRAKAVHQMERMKQSVAGYEQDVEDADARWSKIKTKLQDLHKTFLDMYTTFGKMEGARAGMSFESDWDQNIAELSRLNPQFDFKRIHTRNAVVMTNILGVDELPGSGAVLGYEIGGSLSQGHMTFPSYPSSMAGNVRLSLIGTCPILHPELFNVNIPNGTDQMKYGMIVSYEFPSAFTVDITANYNMYKMYQKIVKSKKKGGFFRSSKMTSVEEKTLFRDEFKVVWNVQDEALAFTREEQADIEKEMRNNIFARLAVIGLPAVTNPTELVLASPGPSGAAVLASSLANNRECKMNKYCRAASIGFSVLDAIFGSSTATTSYTNIQDVDMTERWSKTEVVYKPWISTYR